MLRGLIGKAAAALVITIAIVSTAAAQSRIALVIGNSAYQAAPPLKTTAADAAIVAETLRGAGYDVTELRDLRQAGIGQTMREFLDKVAAAGPQGVAFVYFAGYAAQSDGENYLVPVDAVINRDVEVANEAFNLNDLIDELAKLQLAARVVVLDASRDHKFGSSGNQPVPKGLAMEDAIPGMLIAFAAAPGAVTSEADAPYSLFTATLVTLMRQPGLDMEQIFKAARLQVNKATAGEQTPWMTGDLAIDLTLFAATAAEPAPQAVAGGVRIPPKGERVVTKEMMRGLPADEAYLIAVEEDSLEAYQWFVELFPRHQDAAAVWDIIETRREAVLWRRTLAQNTTRAYWNYLKRYPNGAHAAEAQDRLAALSAPRTPPVAYVPVPEPLPLDYYDEAVGLPEIVQEGFDLPFMVFETFDTFAPIFIPRGPRGPRDFDRRRRDRFVPTIPVVRGTPVGAFTQRDGRDRTRDRNKDKKKTGIVRTDPNTGLRSPGTGVRGPGSGTPAGTGVRGPGTGTPAGTGVRDGTTKTGTGTRKTGVGLPPSSGAKTTPGTVRDGGRAPPGTGTGVRGPGSGPRTGVGLPPSGATPQTGVRPTTPGTPTTPQTGVRPTTPTTPPTGVRPTAPTTPPTGVRPTAPTTLPTGVRPTTPPTIPAVPQTGVRPTTPTTPPTGVRPTAPTTPPTGVRPTTPTTPPTGVRPTAPTTPPTGVRPTTPTTPPTGVRPTAPTTPPTGVRPTTPAPTPPSTVRPVTPAPTGARPQPPASSQRPALPPTTRPTTAPVRQPPTSSQRPALPPRVSAPPRPAAPPRVSAPPRPAAAPPRVAPRPAAPPPRAAPRPAAPPPRAAAPPPRPAAPAKPACPPGKRC